MLKFVNVIVAKNHQISILHHQLRFLLIDGTGGTLLVHDTGGHGVRPDDTIPITDWPARCRVWLIKNQWIADSDQP